MRALPLSLAALLVAACTRPDAVPAADTTAVTQEPAAAALSLADIAGRWNVVSTPESGPDTTPTPYTMTTTATTDGWTFEFNNRPGTVPLRNVMVDGDSVMSEAGPFESSRRAGVQVSTRSVMRLVDGRLVGTTRASYATTGADSVLVLRVEATRAQ
jgi:hypothetical protein